MATPQRQQVLVLRALGLGDFLTGVPALRALREAFPDHHLVLAAPSVFEPLARGIGVDEVLDIDYRTGFSSPLPARGVEVGVNLHGRGPDSHRAVLAVAPRRFVAFAHPAVSETRGQPRWREHEHEVQRWCRLLEESQIPADPERLAVPVPPARSPAVAVGATVVHPGSAAASKRWPAPRWAAVAAAEQSAGRAVVITGDAAEREVAQEVARAAGVPAEHVLAGRTDLLGLVRVVAAAGRVVSADTGIAHLATALSTPSVVLFGPVSPARWGPPARPWHRSLWAGIESDPHASSPAPGLLRITVDDVLDALRALPDRSAGSHVA